MWSLIHFTPHDSRLSDAGDLPHLGDLDTEPLFARLDHRLTQGRRRVTAGRPDLALPPREFHAPVSLIDIGAENLAFAEGLAGRRADPGRVEAALAKVGMDGLAGTRVRALSSGLRRRVALARAMLHEPRVLLLDEAFSGLDQDGTKRLEDYLHAFKAGGGAAVVVTHSLGRALAIADRVVILAGGRIAAETTRASLTEEALQRLYLGATDASA